LSWSNNQYQYIIAITGVFTAITTTTNASQQQQQSITQENSSSTTTTSSSEPTGIFGIPGLP
jgi:hypothetical protein